MKDLFEQSFQISQKDPNGDILANHLGKLFEEGGEFAQSVNKFIGTKTLHENDTKESIQENIAEEAADQIQCIFIICKLSGISYEMIKEKLKEKNQTYSDYLETKNELSYES